MRASLKYLHSPDIEDLDCYVPPDPSSFGFLLQAMFGAEGGPGEESFDMIVCTPAWLQIELTKFAGILSGRHYLFVERYNINQIRQYLTNYAKQCEGKTWREVAEKLARFGKWEFEDYRPVG